MQMHVLQEIIATYLNDRCFVSFPRVILNFLVSLSLQALSLLLFVSVRTAHPLYRGMLCLFHKVRGATGSGKDKINHFI